MYSVFGTRVSPNRANVQQENNIIARKPGLSARKPLADRKINQKQEPSTFVKQKQVQPVKPIEKDVLDFDVCSYKEVKDTYNDIYVPSFFNQHEIDDISSFLSGKIPKTPPAKKKLVPEPEFVTSVRFRESFESFSVLNKIRNTSNKYDITNLIDAPMPDFDEEFE